MWKSKKAASVWISWVLVVSLVVILGTFFFQWSRGFTTDSVEDATNRGDNIVLCENVAFRIDNVCQNTQTLNINITNSDRLSIDGLIFRMFDIYDNPFSVIINTSSIDPEESQSIDVIKQGVVSSIDVIPLTKQKRKFIVCQASAVSTQDLPFCQ